MKITSRVNNLEVYLLSIILGIIVVSLVFNSLPNFVNDAQDLLPSNYSSPLRSSLVYYWTLDGNNSDGLTDKVGNIQNISLIGSIPSINSCINNNCSYSLNNQTTNKLVLPIYQPSNEFLLGTINSSVSFWFNYSTNATSDIVIASRGVQGGNNYYLIRVFENGTLHELIGVNSRYALTNMQENIWNHFVYTINDTASYTYINGELVINLGSAYDSSVGNFDYLGDYKVSGSSSDRNVTWDEVSFYNKSFNISDVTYLYNSRNYTDVTAFNVIVEPDKPNSAPQYLFIIVVCALILLVYYVYSNIYIQI